MAKIEMKIGGASERERFFAVQEAVFSSEAVERKKRAWNWLFENPTSDAGRETQVQLIERQGKPIGVQILLPCRLVICGKTIDAIMPMSTAVHPDHRGAGLQLLKASFTKEIATASSGLAGNDKLNKVYERFGGKLSPKRTLRRKAYKLGTILSEKLPLPVVISKAIDVIASLPLRLLNLRQPKPYKNEEISTITRFSDEFDEAWSKIVSEIGFAQARTCKFLNWRYIDMPTVEYICAQLRRDDVLAGYIIITVHTLKNVKIGRVSDIFTYHDSKRDYALLMSWADRQFRSAECTRSEITFGNNPKIDAAAVQCGFFSQKKIRAIATFVSDPLTQTSVESGLKNFHFCRGDHDEEY